MFHIFERIDQEAEILRKRLFLDLPFLSLLVFCFIGSISYEYLDLISFPLREKIAILLIPWGVISLFLLSIFLRIKTHLQIFSIGLSRSIFLFLLLLSFGLALYQFFFVRSFPSWNGIVISVNNDSNSNDTLDIIQVSTIGSDGQPEQIPGHKINASGICSVSDSHISCQGSGFGSIEYQEFSINSISVLFQGTPSGSKVNIHWNGSDQTVDTLLVDADQFYVDFPYVFRWTNQSFMRKIELIMLFICNAIFYFTILFLLALVVTKKKSIWTSFSKNKHLVFFSVILIALSFGNLLQFQQYQIGDTFKLQRVPGNTLIDLDNTSHDNVKNLQVFLIFYQYFNNHDLYITEDQLSAFRLNSYSFLEISRAKSVNIITGKQDLSQEEVEILKDKPLKTILPAGRIRFTYTFILEPLEETSGICAWDYEDTLYFIPIQDEFDCLQGAQ